jgi:NifU-like protein involved in Fe-S cluster formation
LRNADFGLRIKRQASLSPKSEIRIPQSKYPMPYSAALQDHLAHPRNAGALADANAVAELTNPVCGDRLRLTLRIADDRIVAARFLAYGCPPTLACGSALAEMIEGMTTDEAAALTRQDLARALDGLPARKTHAAALALETLHVALQQCDSSA